MKGRKEIFMIIAAVAVIALFSSCRRAGSEEYPDIVFSDQYIEGQDYNPTAFCWGSPPNTAAVTADGIYFKSGSFLFFADKSTMKARPLCYKLACAHINASPDKVTLCNAFSEVSSMDKDFLGVFRDHLYYTTLNCSTGLNALVRTNLDGSGRKVLIDDVNSILANNMRIHRGVLYFPEKVIDLDGNVRYTFQAMDITRDEPEKEVLFDGSNVAGSFSEVLPYGNYIYYNEKFLIERDDGTKWAKNRFSRYHILEKTTETLTELVDFDLYGVVDRRLIFYDGSDYYEMNIETKEIKVTDLGIQKYQESHPDWICHAHSITEKISFFSCFDEDNVVVWNRIYVNENGEETCRTEEPNCILPMCTCQIIRFNQEDYYLRFAADVHRYTVGLYKVDDLLQGVINPKVILKETDLNDLSAQYTYTINK